MSTNAKPCSTEKQKSEAAFNWSDPLLIEEELTSEERIVRDSARAFCQERLMTRVRDGFRNETFDRAIMTEMAEIGFLGINLPEPYGGGNLNYVSYGLVEHA